MNRVTVIIPTWLRANYLARCLTALERQTRLPEEVIVVGRREDTPAQQVVADFAKRSHLLVRWVEVDKPGHIAPIKRGLEETKGEIVAFLDDDTEAERGWLQALLEPFVDPKVACVGGRVIVPNFHGKVHPDAGRIRWYGKCVGNIGALEASAPVEVDGVLECNWAWRVRILRQLDFDPVFDFDDASMYGLDLCLQAKALGYRVIYYSAARVVHHIAPRDPTLNRQDRPRRTFTYSRNYTYLAMKHFRGWRRISFMLWWWLIGERGSYGVVLSISNLILYGHKTWPILKASFIGKWIGTKIWLKNCRNKGR